MPESTVYRSTRQHDSGLFRNWEESDEEDLGQPVSEQFSSKAFGKRVADVIGGSAWQVAQQTFSYRWAGRDSLTWGNLDRWIQAKYLQGLIEIPRSRVDHVLKQSETVCDIIESTRLPGLEDLYTFRNSVAVRHFLLCHPHLIDLLFEAYPHLARCFGPNPQVALEVVQDPEVADWTQLVAYILTSLPVNQALDRLDRFDDEWFLDQVDQVDDLFNFNLEVL